MILAEGLQFIYLHENELSEVSVVVVCSCLLHIGAFSDTVN